MAVSVDEARQLLATVQPRLRRQTLRLDRALGRTLAEAMDAPIDLPPFSRAAMDGYALRASDTESAPVTLPVVGIQAAGDAPCTLGAGSAMRIFTGAMIPSGADTVIEQEVVQADRHHVKIARPILCGRNIMAKGHEIGRGERVFGVGERLTSTHIALLASLGIETVKVWSRLRVAILQTGSELVTAGRTLLSGQIYETHARWLPALVNEWGGRVTALDSTPDNPDRIRLLLERLADNADLVLITGGTSVGTHDYVPDVLDALGHRLFWRVSMHPGKAVVAGSRDHTLMLGLSGNPGAAMTSWLVLGAPWWASAHQARLWQRLYQLPLENCYPKLSREPRYLRVRRSAEGLRWDLPQGADVLTAYLEADGFAILPPGGRLEADTLVPYWEPTGMGGRYPRWMAADADLEQNTDPRPS